MPAKNSIKQYLEGGFYHIYNRGVEKRDIFIDEFDYKMFLSYLKNYLSAPYPKQVRPVRASDIHEQIKLICFCLMPNHFHLLVKQSSQFGIVSFMRRLSNAYTKYFNERYERVGHLFQGKYKATLIQEDPYLLHLSRYIHLNSVELLDEYRSDLKLYPYSSYGDYLGMRNTQWVHPEEILSFFKTAQKTNLKDILSYQSFVENYSVNSAQFLGGFTLEEVDD